MTYQEAFKELKEISQKVENENLEIDKIEELLVRAEELANICRASLRRVSEKLSDFQKSQFEE